MMRLETRFKFPLNDTPTGCNRAAYKTLPPLVKKYKLFPTKLHFIALYQELKISQQVFIAFFNEINDLA